MSKLSVTRGDPMNYKCNTPAKCALNFHRQVLSPSASDRRPASSFDFAISLSERGLRASRCAIMLKRALRFTTAKRTGKRPSPLRANCEYYRDGALNRGVWERSKIISERINLTISAIMSGRANFYWTPLYARII